jgi:hypothetical protein
MQHPKEDHAGRIFEACLAYEQTRQQIEDAGRQGARLCRADLCAVSAPSSIAASSSPFLNQYLQIASDIAATCAISLTSWTLTMSTPPRIAAATVAAVPQTLSLGS